jgi:hypothetical protein
MKNERSQLKSELARTSIKENYIEYVKIERKIIKLEKDIQVCNHNREYCSKQHSMSFTLLQDENDSDVVKNFLLKYGINYGVKFIIGFSLFLVTILNRKQAVIVFGDKFNFTPFSSVISYPSNIENSISLPFWVFINNYVFRKLLIKLN